MSTTTAATPNSPAKTRKDREREKEKEKALLAAERLKTVVRRLPPNLPEDVFWKSVEPWVSEETVSWKIYYKGKFRSRWVYSPPHAGISMAYSRLNKENMPSRAYIAFKNPEQIAVFSQSYDGHMFRDKAGNESYAVVEYAPYQKVPMEKKKADARNATIENDEDYISFLATLKATAEPVSLETLIASSQPAPQPKTTPLLEALKAEKSASKDKEAILRNHAHYKEHPRTQAGQAARAKEEAKKKGSALPNKPTESGPSGKKPKKPANTNGNANATTPNGVKAPAPAPGGAVHQSRSQPERLELRVSNMRNPAVPHLHPQ
ncbi:Smg-4/UPF3 family-domain-containing protein [Infundibulicybe gibba]|nr:Smg-4/UPF3 family-domain-containing protein [Infundibulicybe gibba]